MKEQGTAPDLAKAVVTYLAFMVDKLAERGTSVCRWNAGREEVESPIANGKVSMVWDFPEVSPFGGGSGSWAQAERDVTRAAHELANASGPPANVLRGSATSLPYEDAFFDAVITDPPYYDNIPYADLSDFFYVWLRRVLGDLHAEHLAAPLAPKRGEATALSSRYNDDFDAAKSGYEEMMTKSFYEARRVLKPGAPLVCVYAHKTVAGWSTLIEALRRSGFVVTEAWPVDVEMGERLHAQDAASLRSNILLVGRRREEERTGSYDNDVLPALREIVQERIETLWQLGISGADLVIAAVGAGLRSYTRFERVEYDNGEEVPAELFLREVEGLVLETLLEKIFGVEGAGIGAVDGPSAFYVLWRYTYRNTDLDAGEAIVFTYSQPIELDGSGGLSAGPRPLVEKKGAKGKNVRYRVRDFIERGHDEKLGLPGEDGSVPLIDALHRSLYLMEYQPGALPAFLAEAAPDRERLRLLANVLARPALKGGDGDHAITTQREQAALAKLVANWRTLMEGRIKAEERAGQGRLL